MNNKAIHVIALDLDNTLLRSDRTVSARAMDVLSRCEAAGKRIVIATSRPRPSVALVLPPDLARAVWICQNGAEIYEDGEQIFQSHIAHASSATIIRWLVAHYPSLKVSVEIGDALFANPSHGEYGRARPAQVVELESLLGRPMTRIVVDLSGIADHAPFANIVPPDCRWLVSDNGRFGLISDVSVSKVEGVRFALTRWNLGMENVIAFGDDVPDLDLIKESGVGVAMGNAIAEVKAVADLIARPNDEDGVAEVLERLLLDPAGSGDEQMGSAEVSCP